MNVNIYYFSGTNNTKWVASTIKEALEDIGMFVSLFNIEEVDTCPPCDLLMIGGPIYAGNVPKRVLKWLKHSVEESHGTQAVVFTTSATLNNAYGTISMGKKLQAKGYKVKGQWQFVLPRNYYFSNFEPVSPHKIPEMFQKAKEQVVQEITGLEHAESPLIANKTLGIDMAASMMATFSPLMGKQFSVNDSCTKCGLCVKNCPTQNIYIKGRVKYKMRCMMCTKCIHNCPEHAILYHKKQYPQYKHIV